MPHVKKPGPALPQRPTPAGYKPCAKCGREYPMTTEFYTRRAAAPDGLHSWCKPCQQEYDRARRLRKKLHIEEVDAERAQALAEIVANTPIKPNGLYKHYWEYLED